MSVDPERVRIVAYFPSKDGKELEPRSYVAVDALASYLRERGLSERATAEVVYIVEHGAAIPNHPDYVTREAHRER